MRCDAMHMVADILRSLDYTVVPSDVMPDASQQPSLLRGDGWKRNGNMVEGGDQRNNYYDHPPRYISCSQPLLLLFIAAHLPHPYSRRHFPLYSQTHN